MPEARSKFVDYDARRTPKTASCCCLCQRDLDPARAHRAVYLDEGMNAIHPDDLDARGARASDYGWHLIGGDCAAQLGLAFTVPQEASRTVRATPVKTPALRGKRARKGA